MERAVWAPFAGRGKARCLEDGLVKAGAAGGPLSEPALLGLVAEKHLAIGVLHGRQALARVASVPADRTVAVDLKGPDGRRIGGAAVRVPEATWACATAAASAAFGFLLAFGYRPFAGPVAFENAGGSFVGGVDALAEDRDPTGSTVLVELFTTSRVAAKPAPGSSAPAPLLKRMRAKASASLGALCAAASDRLPPAAQLASVLLVLTVEVERRGAMPRVSAERFRIRGSGPKTALDLERRVVRVGEAPEPELPSVSPRTAKQLKAEEAEESAAQDAVERVVALPERGPPGCVLAADYLRARKRGLSDADLNSRVFPHLKRLAGQWGWELNDSDSDSDFAGFQRSRRGGSGRPWVVDRAALLEAHRKEFGLAE